MFLLEELTLYVGRLGEIGPLLLEAGRCLKDVVETHAHALGVTLDLKIEIISGDNEAMYEQRAVEHACARMDRPLPSAVLSAGSGSMQLSSSRMRVVASIPTALAVGQDLMRSGNAELWVHKVTESFHACDVLKQRLQQRLDQRQPLLPTLLLLFQVQPAQLVLPCLH